MAIAGGAAAGLALALALHKHGVSAEIFDAAPAAASADDPRILALSHGSVQTLDWLGVWSALAGQTAPIRTIHVSQRGGPGRTRLDSAEQRVPALGQVCPAAALIAALRDAVRARGIPFHADAKVDEAVATDEGVRFRAGAGEHRAALLAYAEGTVEDGPHLRRRDYGQHAVTCTATLAAPHAGTAWERFTPHGPVALLPLPDPRQAAVVYTCAPDAADALLALDDAGFAAALALEFSGRLTIAAATARHRFPLGLRYRDEPVARRQVWLGNAAQTLHPVAGQGYNLALRDIRDLARLLGAGGDPGDPARLARYERSRNLDRRGTIAITDGLVRLFSNDHVLLRHARGAGLLALDLLPPLRGMLARRMMFGHRGG